MNFPPQVQSYFEDHKISNQVIDDFQIDWSGKKIVYPIFDINGEKSFYIYRRDPASEIGPKFTYQTGSHVALYGIHRAKNEKSILICEGLSDCLSCWSAGVPAITSTGGALSFQKEWKDLLCDKEITILLDNDEAGGKGTNKVLDIFPDAKVAFLPDKKEIKDISNFVFNGGDLKKLLQSARHFSNLEEVKSDYSDRITLMKPVWFHESYFASHPEFPPEEVEISKRTGDLLAKAKQYPISSLVKFNRVHKTLCLWHSDTIPSSQYYPKNNKTYCFSCGKSADSIDFYMQLHNCSFLEAVAALQQ